MEKDERNLIFLSIVYSKCLLDQLVENSFDCH